MASVPAELKYSKSHEWVKLEGDVAVIGITDHAQAELGDITYLDLPEVGRMVQVDGLFGEVESVKAVSELFSPLSGEVVETNTEIANATELVNEDPYGKGWLIKVRFGKTEELAALLDAADYEKFADEGGH
jgi:glycine cleavage system H protein